MYYEAEPKEYHGAIVDLTDRCNLRCRHCFYYRIEHDRQELGDEQLLSELEILRDRHKIRSMEWCGGEPLMRRELFEKGAALFQHNVLYTNGTRGIPKIDNVTTCISLDGPPQRHDYVRGEGCFEQIAENLKATNNQVVTVLCTLNRANAVDLDEFLRCVESLQHDGLHLPVFFLFFTPLKQYRQIKGYHHSDEQRAELAFSWQERDQLLQEVNEVRNKYPGQILNSELVLELMHSENAASCIENCNRSQVTLTLDLQLERKYPCVMGPDVDCDRCGCPFPYEREARKRVRAGTVQRRDRLPGLL